MIRRVEGDGSRIASGHNYKDTESILVNKLTEVPSSGGTVTENLGAGGLAGRARRPPGHPKVT